MFVHCIALRNITPLAFPSSRRAGRSIAVPSASRRDEETLALPSAATSRRQVSGVSRALTRASPASVWGIGLPRLTSLKSSAGVRKGRPGPSFGGDDGRAGGPATLARAAPAPSRSASRRENGFITTLLP